MVLFSIKVKFSSLTCIHLSFRNKSLNIYEGEKLNEFENSNFAVNHTKMRRENSRLRMFWIQKVRRTIQYKLDI